MVRKVGLKMQRLRYEKYNNSDNAIIIDLHNGYVVMAISGYNREDKLYTTSLFISEKSTDEWHLINNPEHITFEETYKTINTAILKYISKCLNDGFFNYYIKQYEYQLKCFEKGNEFFESIGDTND